MAHHQRERLIAGLAAVVVERGYASATIGEIAAAAHVSRRVFYEHFDSKEECFLAAFDVVFEHLKRLMTEAAAVHQGNWPRQLIAAVAAALNFLASEPNLARLCLVESPSAGPELQHRFGEVAEILSPYLLAGRNGREGSQALPESTESSLIGAMATRLHLEVALHGAEGLTALLPDLAEFILTPYLGSEDAKQCVAESSKDEPG